MTCSSASPGWFVKVIKEVIKGVERVAVYPGDIIVFDPIPSAHTTNIWALFARLRKHNHYISPANAKRGAITAPIVWVTPSPLVASAPTPPRSPPSLRCPCPETRNKYAHFLEASTTTASSWPTFLDVFAPLTPYRKKTPPSTLPLQLKPPSATPFRELAKPPIPVYLDCDAVANNPCLFLLYRDDSLHGVYGNLDQEQSDGSVRPIPYIFHATLYSDRS